MHADEHQSFLQVDVKTLGIKVSYEVMLLLLMGMIKHSQSTQGRLQYLYNISKKKKKKNWDGVYFLHSDKHQSFYKLVLLFLMDVARHVQSTQNRNLVIFLQYINKKVLQLLLCSIVMQNIEVFYRSPIMFLVTCYN